MNKQELFARTGEAALRNRQAQRERDQLEEHGNYLAARKARDAAAIAQRALDALLDEAEQKGA